MLRFPAASYDIIDLTHTLNPDVPTWNGTCDFKQNIFLDYEEVCRVQTIQLNAGTGTHIDAPSHFIPGGKSAADLSLEELIVPLCVIDVAKKIHPDYYISVQDIQEFETQYGQIEPSSAVIGYTGWDQYWNDPQKYRNPDKNGKMHFPGFSKEAALLLLERNIQGIGIDTLSPDCLDLTFPVHHLILGASKYIVENLTRCQALPPKGAFGIFLPIKTQDGTEAVMRAAALIPASSVETGPS